MLNRKYADFRHAEAQAPRVLRCVLDESPQGVARLGARARRKTKAGAVLGEPGWTWAMFLRRERWFSVTAVFDARARLVAYYTDICTPPEEEDGVLSFLDLKLDLLQEASGKTSWLDQEAYEREVKARTIRASWQRQVERAVAEIDAARNRGGFPPPEVRNFRPR